MAAKVRAPNLVLRRIREEERNESRDDFARAVIDAGRLVGEPGLACDSRLVAKWEDGDVVRPRPAYRRALEALTGRPFDALGFASNAIPMASSDELALDRLAFHVDDQGQVWATVNRRRFLVGSTAALLAQAGGSAVGQPPIVAGAGSDPYGFAGFAQERWPDLRVSRPTPDYGVDYAALLPDGRTVEGAPLRLQVNAAREMNGRVAVTFADGTRWAEFSRGMGRGLLIGADVSAGQPRYFALDTREARRRATSDSGGMVTIPAAYELDDFTYGLIWACASLDSGLQADDQELAVSREDLAEYEKLSSSAVSREAVPDLGVVSHMWLGSEFCARHILRNLDSLNEVPAFWTREQRGEEACTWLLFDHKYPYLRATRSRFGNASTRMFCIPEAAVKESPRHERILLFLAVALMESSGIHAKVCDDPAYSTVEGFVLDGSERAIIANWVRGSGMWHVDSTQRTSVLREFREATGTVSAHSVIDGANPRRRLQALAKYLDLDWSWLRQRSAELARAGSSGLLRPRSRMISVEGIDVACGYVSEIEKISA